MKFNVDSTIRRRVRLRLARASLLACLPLFALTARLCAAGNVEPRSAPEPLRLLTIGNSFSRNATSQLRGLMTAAGVDFIHHQASLSGCSLQRHWESVEAFESAPDSGTGRVYRIERRDLSLREALQLEPWDFVTLQQVSAYSVHADTFFPYAENLLGYIRRHAPSATVLIHQTWAWHPYDPRFAERGFAAEEMHRRLTENYLEMARRLELGVIPTGAAFNRALTRPGWTFVSRDPAFDFENARPPELPDQTGSLFIGWNWATHWRTKKQSLTVNSHANLEGCYLGSAVFFRVLTDRPVLGNGYVPQGMDPARARLLQTIADETVDAGEPALDLHHARRDPPRP